MAINSFVGSGNLTADPEMKYVGETPKTSFSIAINKGKDKDPVYLDIDCWEKLAENCAEYLRKGDHVVVAGSIEQDTWVDRETDKKRSKMYLRAFNVEFPPKRDSNRDDREERPSRSRDRDDDRRPRRDDRDSDRGRSRGGPRDDLDDLPF